MDVEPCLGQRAFEQQHRQFGASEPMQEHNFCSAFVVSRKERQKPDHIVAADHDADSKQND